MASSTTTNDGVSLTEGRATPSAQLDWLKKLARLGYAARGTIYLLIGGLALLAAFGTGGQSAGSKDALSALLGAPGGWIIVLIIAVGLWGYSIWRFCQAYYDTDHHGTGAKGLAIRSGLLISAVTHTFLGIWAGAAAVGLSQSSDGDSSRESLVSWVLSLPFGAWLVGIAGVAIIGAGISQIAKGHYEKFEKYFVWNQSTRQTMVPVCKFGLYARGVVFAIVGGFVVYAAITADPDQAGGVAEALQWLRGQAYGSILFVGVAVGLLSFGVYSWLEAIYRRINTAQL